MTYRGKPSRGCKQCRFKRKKCDERVGGCLRCEKARVLCPGYPEIPDVIFLDQTAQVARKSQSASPSTELNISTPSTVVVTSTKTSSHDDDFFTDWHGYMSSQDLRPLQPPKNELFITFFLATHVSNPHVAVHFPVKDFQSPLTTSMTAMGGALLALNSWDGPLMQKAHYQYGKALCLTNTALADPRLALEDTTLLSVLILTAFETLAGRPEKTLNGWSSHVQGATLLLQLRGLQQVHSREGRVLFLQAAAGILIACLKGRRPVPRIIHRLTAELANYISDPTDPTWKLHVFSGEFVDFWHDVFTFKIVDPNVILSRVARMQETLQTAFDGAPEAWRYTICGELEVTPEGLPKYYYLYVSRSVALLYSWSRAYKHMLYAATRYASSLPGVSQEYKTLFADSAAECQVVQNDMVASIPQELGLLYSPAELDTILDREWLSRPPALTSVWQAVPHNLYFFDEADNGRLPVMHTLGGFGLLWPLYSLGRSSNISPRMRGLVKKIFKFLSEQHRITQASSLLDSLNELA